MTAVTPRRVVVVGAGFGGLWAARALRGHGLEVVVVDRNNFHTFYPLLYQVGAAELVPSDIAFPIRAIFRDDPDVTVRMAEVREVDPEARVVRTDRGEIAWDTLILALGSEPHYFGIDGAAEHAFPMREMSQAIPLRHQILRCFEEAVVEPDPERRRRLLSFVVVGGGPTGVEFTGALAELVHGPLLRDFPDLDPDEVSITILEGMDQLLPGMDEGLAGYAADRLRSRGVEVRTGTMVEEVRADAVLMEDGTTCPTETTVWTAGVRGTPRAEAWGLPVAKGGRVAVAPGLHLEENPDVYVVGDLAYVEDDEGNPLPQVAPVATQQGEHAAANILARARGEPTQPFRYDDPGMLAVIGRNAAVARVFGTTFKGFPAWVVWALVHIAKLIGGRNRVSVFINWAWNYVSYKRAVRLVLAGVGEEGGERGDAERP